MKASWKLGSGPSVFAISRLQISTHPIQSEGFVIPLSHSLRTPIDLNITLMFNFYNNPLVNNISGRTIICKIPSVTILFSLTITSSLSLSLFTTSVEEVVAVVVDEASCISSILHHFAFMASSDAVTIGGSIFVPAAADDVGVSSAKHWDIT